MLVVAIIGMMAAAVAPAIATAMAEGRASSASVDLVRLGGRARVETLSTGLAHLLRYSQVEYGQGQDKLGLVQLLRGNRNICNMMQGVWDNNNSVLIDRVDMTDYNLGVTHKINLQPINQGDVTTFDICFQPDGTMRTRAVTGPFNFGGDVEFSITRTIGGHQQGPQRLVLFTSGGFARLER